MKSWSEPQGMWCPVGTLGWEESGARPQLPSADIARHGTLSLGHTLLFLVSEVGVSQGG